MKSPGCVFCLQLLPLPFLKGWNCYNGPSWKLSSQGRRLINCVPITPTFTPTELWASIWFRYPWHAQSPSGSQCVIGHVQNNYIERSINLFHLKVDSFSQGTLLVCQELVLVPGIGKLFYSSASSKHAFTPHFFNSYLFKDKLANYFDKSWMN